MMASMPPSTVGDQVAIQLIHDARAVHDIASLRFGEFREDGKPSWIAAVVKPAADSGAASVPDAHIQSDTGQFVAPPGAEPVVSKIGTWEALFKAASATKTETAPYSWQESFTERRGSPSAEDYYSPFATGGTIVFRFDQGAKGIEQFHAARLIFPDWANELPQASDFVEGHSGLLENGEQRADELVQLRELVRDKNRFVAVEAFRELAEDGHLDANVVRESLTRVAAPQDAVLIYLILTCRGGEQFDEQISAVIKSATGQGKLRSIALGAFAASFFARGGLNSAPRSKILLQEIRRRMQQLNIQPQDNAYLFVILNKTGT